MTRKDKILIGVLQDCIGKARAAYDNDRDQSRYTHVMEPLDKGFNIAVAMLSRYQQVKVTPDEEKSVIREILQETEWIG